MSRHPTGRLPTRTPGGSPPSGSRRPAIRRFSLALRPTAVCHQRRRREQAVEAGLLLPIQHVRASHTALLSVLRASDNLTSRVGRHRSSGRASGPPGGRCRLTRTVIRSAPSAASLSVRRRRQFGALSGHRRMATPGQPTLVCTSRQSRHIMSSLCGWPPAHRRAIQACSARFISEAPCRMSR